MINVNDEDEIWLTSQNIYWLKLLLESYSHHDFECAYKKSEDHMKV